MSDFSSPPCSTHAPPGRFRRRPSVASGTIFVLLLLAPFSLLLAGDAAEPPLSPAFNWVLNLFTDADGYRSMTLRGGTMRPASDGSVAVTELNVTVFSGDASARVESVLLSPEATFFPKQNRAIGHKGVRVIRDDLEAISTTWTYDHARKHVTLQGNVRIVLNAEMKGFLK